VPVHTVSYHTVTSIMGDDPNTTRPRWRVSSMEVGGDRGGGGGVDGEKDKIGQGERE
jgi:hypothetical protein